MTQQSVVDQAKELEAMGYTREQVVSMLAQPTQVQVSKLRRPYTPDALDQEVSDFKAAKVAENQNSTYPVKAARVVFKIMSVVGEETGTLDPEPRDFDRIFRRSYPRNKLSTEGRGAHDTALAVMRGYSIWREENGFPNGFLENEEYYTVKDEQRREDALDSEELLAMIRAARGIADGSIRTRRTRVDKRGRNGESGHVRDEIDEQIPITLRCAYDTGTRPSEVVRLHEGNLSNKAMPGVGYPITFCHTKTADNLVRYLSQKTYEELVERIKSDAVRNAPKGNCKYCGETIRWFFPALSESNNPNL